MALKVLGDRVMIKVDEAEETEGGIVLPETAQKKPQRGTVVAVGEGRKTETGDIIAPPVEEGDTVVFAEYGGHDITVDGEEYKILDVDQLYGKLV
ncbi:MAG: co-chaperone GroES [Armatimonadota bacterium]